MSFARLAKPAIKSSTFVFSNGGGPLPRTHACVYNSIYTEERERAVADCVISTNRITRSGTQRVLLSCRFGATRYKQKHAPRAEQGVQEKGRETGGDSTRGSLSNFDAEHEKRGGISKFLSSGQSTFTHSIATFRVFTGVDWTRTRAFHRRIHLLESIGHKQFV